MKKEEFSYLLARLPIGMSFIGHGLVRLPKLEAFSNGLVNSFSKSVIPAFLVLPFSYTLPFLELLTGIFLFFGFFTRLGLMLGSLIMLALIFGSSMTEQWDNVCIQLFYSAYLALLYYFIHFNKISIDGRSNKI